MRTLMDMAKAAIQKATLDDQTCWFFGWHIFQSLVVYAVFSKHEGFREEQEYRVLYRKIFDQLGLLTRQNQLHRWQSGRRAKAPLPDEAAGV